MIPVNSGVTARTLLRFDGKALPYQLLFVYVSIARNWIKYHEQI